MSDGIGLIVGIVLAVFICYVIGAVPGSIARRRGHANAKAITVCGWFGLLIWPAWVVAVIWAYTGPDNAKQPLPVRDARRGFPLDPIPQDWGKSTDDLIGESLKRDRPATAGRYRISGVDKETRMDTTWHCSADSEANARAKAELEGIVVTSIERV